MSDHKWTDEGLSPQLKDIFDKQRDDHLKRRADRIFATTFWICAIPLSLLASFGFYKLVRLALSFFFGGAS